MKLENVTLSSGATFNFINTDATDGGVKYTEFDGYLEFWDSANQGVGQVYFSMSLEDNADLDALRLTKRNPETGDSVPLSTLGRRAHQLTQTLAEHIQKQYRNFNLLGVKFFYRPGKGLHPSHLSLYVTSSGNRRWNFSIDKNGYFQDDHPQAPERNQRLSA